MRIPDNAVSAALVKALGNPIMTTSVPVGDEEDYFTEPELIAERYIADVEIVIDAGRGGLVPSTIVDCTGEEPEVLRQGAGEL